MRDTLKAADREFREAAEKPVEEMNDSLKGTDKEPSDDREESSPDESDSSTETAA